MRSFCFTLILLIFSTAAFATNIPFSYSGSGYTGSGVFIATNEGGGTYLVTGVTGTQNGLPFTGVEPVTPQFSGYSYDNLLFLKSTPQLDVLGILLDWNGGVVNLGYDNTRYGLWDATTPYPDPSHEIGFSATPEPSTLLTLGSGIVGLVGLARKRLFS